ncbi:MAG: FAD binding domain-containing protein [Jatrophihabitantaceae bacterium]
MKPVPFGYARPASVEEAVTLLNHHAPDARALAGGQSLVPLLNRRLVRPSMLVDLCRVAGLRHLSRDGNTLRVGALTRHAEVERAHDARLWDGFALLPRVAASSGQYPIRTRGTVGGNLAHADPRSEWCLLSVLLDAEIVIAGPTGTRVLSAADFILGPYRTALAPDEIVLELRIPGPLPAAAVRKFSEREGDWAIVAAAAVVELDERNRVRLVRLALAGAADRAICLPDVENLIRGELLEEALLEQVRELVRKSVDPPGDIHGDPHYRRALAGALASRALIAAALENGVPE